MKPKTLFDKPKTRHGFWYHFQAMFGWKDEL